MVKKRCVSIADKIRQEVLKEFTRVPGEDYEEWCEFVRYEVDCRMKEAAEERAKFFRIQQQKQP